MIEFKEVTLAAGKFILERVSFAIPAGEYAVLMGKTGHGKTTILEAICGLRSVSAGQIILNGTDVTHEPPSTRGIGYVPQDLALFPTFSVREHLEFAMKLRGQPARQIRERCDELADLLGIVSLLDRSIVGLSGGESQRVALGRAISFQPSVLLLDEPLSALDDATKSEMYALLKHVTSQQQITTLHVTHSIEEAEILGDYQLKIDGGQVTVEDAA